MGTATPWTLLLESVLAGYAEPATTRSDAFVRHASV